MYNKISEIDTIGESLSKSWFIGEMIGLIEFCRYVYEDQAGEEKTATNASPPPETATNAIPPPET
ncbi:10323_t:CDS:2, partial [Racocetra fulgida]